MATLYSLNIRWVKTPINPQIIENILNRAGDWFRFDGWSWLVASDYGPNDIANALKSVLTPDDSILLIKCDTSSYSGFAPQATWDWLDKHKVSGLAGAIPVVPNALVRPPFKKP